MWNTVESYVSLSAIDSHQPASERRLDYGTFNCHSHMAPFSSNSFISRMHSRLRHHQIDRSEAFQSALVLVATDIAQVTSRQT